MAKPKMSYAEMISQVQVMASGLKNKANEVSKRGITTEFIREMEQLCNEVITLNNEQERVKAELKSKTEALNTQMDKLLEKLRESKKVVKLAIPQTGWLEFGITDKR